MQRHLILLLVFSVFTAGCLTRKPPVVKYYVLEYPGKESVPSFETTIKGSCLVKPVEVSAAYSSNQIAIRENTHELRYFAFNMWAVRPEQALTGIMLRFLDDHQVFEELRSPGLVQEADYTLETRVYNLEVDTEGRDYKARLYIEFSLVDNNQNRLVKEYRIDRNIPLQDRDLNLFAAATSTIFVELLAAFLESAGDSLHQVTENMQDVIKRL